MFTLVNPDESLESVRDYANTKAQGLLLQGMSAEDFTARISRNAQAAYDWAAGKIYGTGEATLSAEDIAKIHQTLCGSLQKGGGVLDPKEAARYNESREQLINDFSQWHARAGHDQRIEAIANHTARCEGIRLFPDHSSTVCRVALEAYMDNEFGPAVRPGESQQNYLDAVVKAQNGNSQDLCYLIKNNHQKAVDAGNKIWPGQSQTLGPDYSTNWKDQDPSIRR